MSHDYCLGCGVALQPNIYECPICGYDNRFGSDHDALIDDEFLNDFDDEFNPQEEHGY